VEGPASESSGTVAEEELLGVTVRGKAWRAARVRGESGERAFNGVSRAARVEGAGGDAGGGKTGVGVVKGTETTEGCCSDIIVVVEVVFVVVCGRS
jgi:hypothetical protein